MKKRGNQLASAPSPQGARQPAPGCSSSSSCHPNPTSSFPNLFQRNRTTPVVVFVFFFPSFLTHFRADPLAALSSLSPTLLRTENRHVALRRLAPHGPVSKLVQKRKKIFKNLSLFKPGTLLVALTSTEGCSMLGELISSRKRATPSLSSTLSFFFVRV